MGAIVVPGRPLQVRDPAPPVTVPAVLTVMGVGTSSTNTFIKDLPLFIALVVLAIFTFVSGLRAPALIALIKDTLIYLMGSPRCSTSRPGPAAGVTSSGRHRPIFAAINPATKKPFGAFVPTAKATGTHLARLRHHRPWLALALFPYPHSSSGRWRPSGAP